MGQGRAAKVLRHNNTQPARLSSCHGPLRSPTLVKSLGSPDDD
jgi:hypothetical protein